MKSVLDQYPGARRALFSAFHIGGCQSCAYQLDETLEEVCKNHEIDLDTALQCLFESQEHDASMLISPEELKALLDGDEPFVFLDTRTREEFEAITLPGAQLMTQELQNSLFAHKKPDQKIILIDHQGRSVLDHCAWFRGHGLTGTYGVDGGIDRYAREVDSSIPRYRLEMD
ncbi:rhodanese-like domain-containing protein [Akkermansiaceae bacterium]|nr:rhodanese-like domain-containing protein [Akkermansiaceae bacterium]MDA9831419.1 rhodanese-like domain-containing protein [Akkermansiaceae bacterium]MDB4509854.1 rhodanese-like domain-containing protein [Akkermansiaceae bacterium]MDB4541848.1 rhodanese-like domain-containing protein [bacterium]MDB4809348.1 rhodanese-like domain-containing protein [bacterium]